MPDNDITLVKDAANSYTDPPMTIGDDSQIYGSVFVDGNSATNDPWLVYEHGADKTKMSLNGELHEIDPKHITKKHPLDVGAGTNYDKQREELAEIRQQYERIIRDMPVLEKLRNEYDKLREKHKLYDAVRGKDDAEI